MSFIPLLLLNDNQQQCPVRSSITGQPCVLPEDHLKVSLHKYAPPVNPYESRFIRRLVNGIAAVMIIIAFLWLISPTGGLKVKDHFEHTSYYNCFIPSANGVWVQTICSVPR